MARGPSDLSIASPLRQYSAQVEAQLKSRIAPALRAELASLAAESDPELWASGMLHLAERIERHGQSAEALLLLENLRASELSGSAAATLAKAERRRQALLGGGHIGDRAELLIGRFAKESTDPVTLASFVAGGSVYKVARGALLARFATSPASALTRGAAARFLAAAGAFGAEVPAFVATAKLGRQVSGHFEDWSREALRTELSTAALSLVFLKSAGALSHRALGGLQAWGAWQAAPGMARFASRALPQAAMFGGILLGHRAEVGLGLRPAPEAGSHEGIEALTSLLHFNVGGRLSDGLLGSGYRRAMRELELRTQGGPGWPTAAWNPGLATAAPGFWMSSNENGGNGAKTGKVIPLFPNGNGGKAPKADATALDSNQIAILREQLTKRATLFLNQAAANLGTFLSVAETYVSYLDRGLGHAEELALMDRLLRSAGNTFLEHFLASRSLYGEMTTYAFGNPEVPRNLSPHEARRAELRDFIDNAPGMNRAFEAVIDRLKEGDSAAGLKALDTWNHLAPYFLVFERSHVLDFGSHHSEVLRASRLLGMAYGMLAQDILQDPAQSGPLKRCAAMKKLVETITGRGERPFSRALVSRYYPDGEKGRPTPREGLAQGGSYDRPFGSWLGLHLPALLLLHQGQVTSVSEVVSAIELFMEPSMIAVSRETLQWLGFALDRKGDPRDWARDQSRRSAAGKALRMAWELEPSPERMAKVLGVKGPKAILAHALHAFFRAGYQPALAIQAASQAPEGIREEVLGLSGALSGAYAGRGTLSHWIFLPALREALPRREIGETMFTAWEEGLLSLPLSYVARPKGFPSRSMPFIRMLGPLEKMSTHHPKWVAFYDGFFERQTESEIVFHTSVARATQFLTEHAERLRVEDWSELREYLSGEIKKIDAGVRSLRAYLKEGSLRLESGGLSPILGRPLFEDLETRLARLQGGLTSYRRFLAGVRFFGSQSERPTSSKELRPLQEKLLAVIANFDVPEDAPFESTLARNWLADFKRQLERALRESP